MNTSPAADRREFLKGAATAGAGLALASAGSLAAQGQDPTTSQQETSRQETSPVKLGVIGCGMMGERHITRLLTMQDYFQVTAVCDVYSIWRDKQAARTGAEAYGDYRKLLESANVDAVLIATPDHWHAKMTIDAADAGKDIYCEKPMTHWRDLQEAKDVVQAVRRNQRVMQVGVQSTSDARYLQAREQLQAGCLGRVTRAQSSFMLNSDHHKYSTLSREPEAIPGETLDWDMWLGPAAKIPFDPARFASFRSFFDYSGGCTTDFLTHRLTPLTLALGVGFPHRVASTGGNYRFSDDREIPDMVNMSVEYPEGPTVYLISGMASPYNLPRQIESPQGILRFEGSGFQILDAGSKVIEEIASTRAPDDGQQRVEHLKDFYHSIHTREKPRCDEWCGYQVMAALHMAVHSYIEGKVFEFDEETEQARAV